MNRSLTTGIDGPVLKIAMVGGLGGLLFGFDTAVISGCTSDLESQFQLSASMLGFVVSSALFGTLLGAMVSGRAGQTFGRRYCLKWLALFFLVSALGCAGSWDLYSLLFFRFLGGIAIGGASVICPVYIAEISPAEWRGRLVGFFQINIVAGILCAYLSNYLVGLADAGALEWRLKFGAEALPAVWFFLALFKVPRSPRWLATVGEEREAREVLQLVGQDPELVARFGQATKEAAPSLFQKKYAKPISLVVLLAIFNQMSGINGLLYYLNDVFDQAGFGKVSADLQSVAIGCTNLLFTLMALRYIDLVGRKTLLLIGAVGMTVSLSAVAWIFATASHQSWLLFFLICFIASFAFSQGAVIWVYIGEVFPNLVRSSGQSLGSFTHWLACAFVSWTFPVFADTRPELPFIVFAGAMAVQFVVVWWYFPETKGRSLEEVAEDMSYASSAAA